LRNLPESTSADHVSLRYRADIDGLRAIAVVPVVLYHYGIAGFSGGFVGVDVFFVISGFLITSLIFAEMREGAFSIAGFYERRARRILPALFAMMAFTAVLALLLLFPRDLTRFSESAAAAALSVSNFDFWNQAGYFDTGAETKPLLHTWSLGVEEQFYVLFPAVLYLLHTRSRRLLLIFVAVLAVVSLAASIWAVRDAPSAAFYLLPFRTWELMFGAILALAAFPVPQSMVIRDVLAAIGLALIGRAVTLYTADTPFPGVAALLPCGGAALVLYACSRDGIVQRILSLRPIVFIGLISYSLYLWHWPLYVLARYVRVGPLPLWESVALIAASVALAVLSWRFVERPFRANRHLFTRKRIFALSGAGIAAFLAFCGASFAGAGFPARFPADVQRIVAESDDVEPRRQGCFNRTPQQVAAGNFCAFGDKTATRPGVLLWGDSHADAILPAVDGGALSWHRKLYFIGRGRCPPLLHIELTDEPTMRCARLNDEALRVAMRPDITTVILAARWAYYDQGTGVGPDANEARHLIDLSSSGQGEDQHTRFARMLAETVNVLLNAGKEVVLVGDVPEVSVPVPETLARIRLYGAQADIRPTRTAFEMREHFVDKAMAGFRRITVLRPGDILCRGGRCAVELDGRPLYADHHHLSVFGAEQFVPMFRLALAR
jgi:peptidoglycan/LPS O-acetylase OafA/YrhL